MVAGSPPNPQPLPDEPWLASLTYEQLARLVEEVSPDVFYQRASAFDQAGARLQDVLDQVRHEMNTVREHWHGTAADDFDDLVRDVTGKVAGVLQFVQAPGYGAALRDAGDRLADHQRRLRDLAGQKAEAESRQATPGGPTPEMVAATSHDSVRQILLDLRVAYWDVGNALPGFAYEPPSTEVGDPTKVNSGAGGDPIGQGDQHHLAGPVPDFSPGMPVALVANLSGPGLPDRPEGGRSGFGDRALGRGQTVSAWFTGDTPVPEVLGQNRQRQKVICPVDEPEPAAVLGRTAPPLPAATGVGVLAGIDRSARTTHREKTVRRSENTDDPVVTDTPAEPRPVAIRTTVDAPPPQPPVDPAPAPRHQAVVATAGISFVPQGTTEPPRLDLPAVEPGGTGEPHVAPVVHGQQQAGAYPMTPMMGGTGMGMGGLGMNQGGRMASMPNRPRPEVWDPVTGEPVAVGRQAPAQEPKEPADRQAPALSKDEIHARFAEKFAELDKLTERRDH
jgi:uncharacterized protein YukE